MNLEFNIFINLTLHLSTTFVFILFPDLAGCVDGMVEEDEYVLPKLYSESKTRIKLSQNNRKRFVLVKPYVCGICKKSYTYSRDLTRHLKLECQKEPQFSCSMCKKCYRHNHTLKNHMETAHMKEILH